MSTPTRLHELAAGAGATFTDDAGWLVPAHYGAVLDEYHHACSAAVFFDESHHGKVELAGKDAASFLHNLSTNEINKLPAGSGCEAFFTTIQAHVVGYALVYHLAGAFWLDVAPGTAEKLIAHLEHYLVSEQVEIHDRTADFMQLHLAGLQARTVLEQATGFRFPDLKPLQHMTRTFPAQIFSQVRRHDPLGLHGYDILCESEKVAAVWQALLAAGASPAGLEAREMLRVEAGTPIHGQDMDESNLAPEVGRTAQAISYTKGCYLGQETIVRMRDLGHVNRLLVGLAIAGEEVPARGASVSVCEKMGTGSDRPVQNPENIIAQPVPVPIFSQTLSAQGKEVGRVTSAVWSPRLDSAIALAYIRRGSNDAGTVVEVEVRGGARSARGLFTIHGRGSRVSYLSNSSTPMLLKTVWSTMGATRLCVR